MVANCSELIEIAAKLRCAPLYRDCLILCMGPYNKPRYGEIKSIPLQHLALAEFRRIIGHMRSAREAQETARTRNPRGSKKTMTSPFIPEGYREAALYCSTSGHWFAEERIRDIVWLGRNNLVLVPEKVHLLRDCFLCTEVSDEDLPWDVGEKEW